MDSNLENTLDNDVIDHYMPYLQEEKKNAGLYHILDKEQGVPWCDNLLFWTNYWPKRSDPQPSIYIEKHNHANHTYRKIKLTATTNTTCVRNINKQHRYALKARKQ